MENGMAKGAYGAVFMDGDGNLYYGLNKGDHDLDASTGAQGAIYKVNVDWEAGQAYSEFMSEAQVTGSNDGTVDPRSADAFGEIDAEAAVLLRNPELTAASGGNDDLRGGDGQDTLFGNGGDDILHGGEGADALSGDEGNDTLHGNSGNDDMSGGTGADRIFGGTGDDTATGGDGADKLYGGAGNDALTGDAGNDTLVGNEGDDALAGGSGKDFMLGGTGADQLDGGADGDKLVGGTGSDTITGGKGDDHLWGGNWSGDNAADSFVFAAGSGKDIIHDFEASHDQIDLRSYGLDYDRLQNVMTDHGWAVEIDLSSLNGGQAGDRVFLKSVDPDDLDESNFLL